MALKDGQLLVDIYCDNCGFTHGTPEGENLNRCTDCGRFVTDNPDVCCTKHKLKNPPYSNQPNHCPLCEEERRIEAERNEMMARRANPRMHPTIDAPRY